MNAPDGWTVSTAVSEEKRTEIEDLISASLTDGSEEEQSSSTEGKQKQPGIVISSSVSEAKQKEIAALLGSLDDGNDDAVVPTGRTNADYPVIEFIFGGETITDHANSISQLTDNHPNAKDSPGSILLQTNAGGIWETVFDALPRPHFYAFPGEVKKEKTKKGFQATIKLNTVGDEYKLGRGEQAGIWAMLNDNNYGELVSE